jgi:hypothetical protein
MTIERCEVKLHLESPPETGISLRGPETAIIDSHDSSAHVDRVPSLGRAFAGHDLALWPRWEVRLLQ